MALGRRLLLALAGLATLCVYGVLAVAGYRLATFLWANRPDPLLAAVVVLTTGIALGYHSYRVGTMQLRRQLDAVPLAPERAPRVHRRLDAVAERMGVARPELLVAELSAPNALAIGGGRDAIVVDRRLLRLLSPTEIEALLAHELAHLETNDALIQTLAYNLVQTLTGVVALIVLPVATLLGGFARAFALVRGQPEAASRSLLGRAQRLALLSIAGLGLVVGLLAMGYSRRREYAADERAAAVADPLALARALRTIERASKPGFGLLTPLYVQGEEDTPLARLLATHPPIDERIERLRAMADHRRIDGR
ncbi:M48 family metallopeptidase [Halomicrobium sp. HM KBTZ05]|uniref:M48 family metallopeptidase n=1 Tax=Halomicrobium sp. HM KBTZ05 TaxID=3242663 RepID=UPI0035569D51